MRTFVNTLLILIAALIMFGCQGGQKSLRIADELDRDSTMAPVFAYSEFLTIDTDMMAEQFLSEQLPVSKKIDSSIAENSVYEMLLDSVLALNFISFNLDDHPLLKKQHDEMYNDYLIRLMYQKHIVDSITVSDSEVVAAYDEHKERFLLPLRYRARHIVISGENLRRSADSSIYMEHTVEEVDSIARSQVESIRQRVLTGANFDTLAIMYSQDPGSAERGGDLGYFELSQMVAPFDSTVAHTPVDSISGVIKTQYGWHVVKVLDKQEEHYASLDSVFTVLSSLMKEKKTQERGTIFIDSVRHNSVMIIDTSVLLVDDSVLQPKAILALINPDDLIYGNDTIFYSEFRKNATYFGRQLRMEFPLSIENKLKITDLLSNKYHMYRAAGIMKYTEIPEIKEWSEKTRMRYAISTMRKDFYKDLLDPTDEELRAYYDSHMEDYQVERPLKIQHIVFEDSSMAEHVRDVASGGADFDELIDQYYPGDDEIKSAAANLGYIGINDMPTDFYRRALVTPIGEISRPVKTEYGYHIIKVLDKNHSVRFESAKNRIKTILKEKAKKSLRNSFIESKIGELPVVLWQNLDKLHYKVLPGPVNPALINRP